ncbi:MAG: polysaccharide biosynthesis tyrosine autokinase [Alphaproteobacteria bacterium]|nr:polysaccharide biosynthesis tyrosine autokinase [Alphaproteobacteria bacterium]
MLIKKTGNDAINNDGSFDMMAPAILGDGSFKDMDLRELANLLRRRLRLIIRVTCAFAALGLLVSMMLTPQYRAETVLMLDQRQASTVDSIVSAMQMDNSALRSEIDIITSRAVIDRVIDKLKLVDDKEFYAGESWMSWINPASWFDESVSPEETARRAKAMVAKALSKRLKVINDGRSFSIRITFDSKDSQKAANIANAFADEYLVDQLEAKYEVTSRANKWLSERLTSLRQQVEITEKAVEDFRQSAKLIEIDGVTVAARQMDEINSQLTAARGQTSQAEARLRSVQNMLQSKGGMDAAADVLSSPLIQRLREQEAEVRRKEAEMAMRYGERHPKMINVHAEYVDLQHKIAEEVQKITRSLANEVDVAKAKEDQIAKDLAALEKKAGAELKDSVQLRQLKREADANRTLYESFLGRFKQTSEQQDLELADSRIIARADPPVSISFPQKWLFVFMGGFLGAIFGVLGAYLIEYFDRGFKSSVRFEEMTGLPVVGLVPNLKGVSDRPPEDYVVDKPLSAYSEALRTVRTAIHFSNVDNPPKTVMVTSATPGEGKTTFCLSLARSLAKAGNKTLLIDADLRRPRVSHILELGESTGGLAAFLAGEKTLAEVIKRDPLVEGLDIIPASGKTPNAQDLLGSQHMQKMVHEVGEQYDLVIIDTPPILAVSDAAMVSQAVDTTLYMVRWGETPRDTVVQALKQLKSFNCRIAGAVMTQVNLSELAGYGDGYYHYRYNEYYTD